MLEAKERARWEAAEKRRDTRTVYYPTGTSSELEIKATCEQHPSLPVYYDWERRELVLIDGEPAEIVYEEAGEWIHLPGEYRFRRRQPLMRYERRYGHAWMVLERIEAHRKKSEEIRAASEESQRAWRRCPDCGKQRTMIDGAFYCGNRYERCYDDA